MCIFVTLRAAIKKGTYDQIAVLSRIRKVLNISISCFLHFNYKVNVVFFTQLLKGYCTNSEFTHKSSLRYI